MIPSLEATLASANNDGPPVPILQNIVSTVNLGCKINLKMLACKARNAEYNPKRFHAVVLRIREPKTTCLVFSSGKMVVTGAKTEASSKIAARMFMRCVMKTGNYKPPVDFDFKIQNIVASCGLEMPIQLETLCLAMKFGKATYEAELFPGLIYRVLKPKVSFLIFASGKVVITGAKVREDTYKAWELMYPLILEHCRRPATCVPRSVEATTSESKRGRKKKVDESRRV